MTAQELAIVENSLSLVGQLVPGAEALIFGAKAIWLAANPGKTDQDWVAGLASAAGDLTTEADKQLIADGFVRDAVTGKWTHPAVPGPLPPA